MTIVTATPQMVISQNRNAKLGGKEKMCIKALLIVAIFISMLFITTYADNDLTQVFSTKAFQGSWEVINKFNWVGYILNFIISAFCILGLFLILYSRMITLLYLSSRNLWDNVYDMKQKKGSWFGFPEMAKSVFNAEHGTGLDAFVGFFYGMLPNVKKYSDYNPEKMKGNLSEEDNAMNYMLKMAPSTIILMFFFAIGFSGTLAKAYGTIVSAMATAADNLVAVNLSGYVDKLFAAGKGYNFSLGQDGTANGKVKASIAKQMYRIAIGKFNILDEHGREEVGQRAEQFVQNSLSDATIAKLAGVKNIEDSGWKNLDYDVIYTTNSNAGEHGIFVPMEKLVPEAGDKGGIQIIFKLDSAQNTPSYFKGAGNIK